MTRGRRLTMRGPWFTAGTLGAAGAASSTTGTSSAIGAAAGGGICGACATSATGAGGSTATGGGGIDGVPSPRSAIHARAKTAAARKAVSAMNALRQNVDRPPARRRGPGAGDADRSSSPTSGPRSASMTTAAVPPFVGRRPRQRAISSRTAAALGRSLALRRIMRATSPARPAGGMREKRGSSGPFVSRRRSRMDAGGPSRKARPSTIS